METEIDTVSAGQIGRNMLRNRILNKEYDLLYL